MTSQNNIVNLFYASSKKLNYANLFTKSVSRMKKVTEVFKHNSCMRRQLVFYY